MAVPWTGLHPPFPWVPLGQLPKRHLMPGLQPGIPGCSDSICFQGPKHADGQAGQPGHPSAPDPLLLAMYGKRENKSQSCGGPVGPPACPPASCRADSCRGKIYLRALTTFSCPVPLWRQRLPKKMPQMRNSSKNQPGPRGALGKRHRAVEQTMERGGRKEVGRKDERKVTKLCSREEKKKQSRIVPPGSGGPQGKAVWVQGAAGAGLGSSWVGSHTLSLASTLTPTASVISTC